MQNGGDLYIYSLNSYYFLVCTATQSAHAFIDYKQYVGGVNNKID
ncbi:hypothetical protein GLIP_2117 [Aliiglaciecola lipolytica E3]|uniref:Uncharacterized protein n=1 Tax=Aliiglaciecola lipolytica E3 TaxID=1127673 RepID=K6YTZ0_9ALTE|nr:hypothetical protein GLIP_2117 [Aliiglaciecola lipolytica E3]